MLARGVRPGKKAWAVGVTKTPKARADVQKKSTAEIARMEVRIRKNLF